MTDTIDMSQALWVCTFSMSGRIDSEIIKDCTVWDFKM